MAETQRRKKLAPVGDFEIAIGKRLRELRMQRTGLSQEKFAYSIDMDRTYYAALERGLHTLSISKLRTIAKGLQMTMSEVLEGMD